MPPRSQQVQAAGQPAAAAGNGQQQQRNESWTGTIVKCLMMFFFLKQFFGGGAKKPQPTVQNRHEMYLPRFNRSEPMVSLLVGRQSLYKSGFANIGLLRDAGALVLSLRSAFAWQCVIPMGLAQAALFGHALLLGSATVLLLAILLSSLRGPALQDFALYLSESSSWADGELIWSKQAVPLATGPELTTSYLYKPSKVGKSFASSLWPDFGPGRDEWQHERAYRLHMDASGDALVSILACTSLAIGPELRCLPGST